jgi:3-hydroxyisobutyrate dehydrogenase
MEKDILKTKEFLTFAKENIILVELDYPKNPANKAKQPEAEVAQNKALDDKFKITGYPTIYLVDAPVSGGVPRAKTGELAIMFGGSTELLERVRPVLACMGTSITPTGDVGSAHAMKALNNLVSAGGFLIGVEALLIGKRFGLDPAAMVDVLNSSTGMNNSTQKKFKQFVLSGKYNAGFGLDLMVKDLSIALGIGRDTNTPTPFSSLCREMWASCAQMLGPGQDHTAIAKLSETLAGDTLSEKTEK